MTLKLKKALLYSFTAVLFFSLLILNVKYTGGSKMTLTAQVMADDESSSGCCPWYIPSIACNQRTQSKTVTCGQTTTYTYYSSSSHVTITGVAKDNGNGIEMVSGYATQFVTTSQSTTSPYQATLVNCPTDGKCLCTEYRPCH